ncbi:N-acetyltransferase [bacterium]|nr:N-acetyltransferase [bacterium]MBP5435184.1 N-acetyltransferase [bacterium]
MMQTKVWIKIAGKNILSTYVHHIMSLECGKCQVSGDNKLRMINVTDTPEQMIGGVYSPAIARKIASKNRGKCDIYVFKDEAGNSVGTISVMYRGGMEIEYKIKNIDAFIYDVRTDEAYRGRGYAGMMIESVCRELTSKGIDKVYLAVSTNNESAIKAYIKSGFVIERTSCFVRFLKINIPYREL